MIDEKTLHLGTLTKYHGTDGSLILHCDNPILDDVYEPEYLFIEFDGLLVPFFVAEEKGFRPKNADQAIVKFDGIASQAQAEELLNKKVFISFDDVDEENEIAVSNSVKDYTVIDVVYGDLGVVEEILEIPNNPILLVRKGEVEYLIPVHQDIILEIDDDNKTVKTKVPEGLLDIN
jgi:16S rRNA processing protein RimM